MSFIHRNLAAVWEQLVGLDDISRTLCEVTGEHALHIALQDDGHEVADESIHAIIWIKAIFDLQRCYLSGTTKGVLECPPPVSYHLLPPELLFSSILYLIDVKARLFSGEATPARRDSSQLRLILAQTVLSGLRLLLLRKEGLSPHKRRHLQRAINTAWKDDDHGQGAEHFIVQSLFMEILDSLGECENVDSYQTERAKARLPTYASGLYSWDIKPEAFVTSLVHAMAEEEDDWLDAYWVLFDTLWAVECAITQRYVDLRRQHSGDNLDLIEVDTDEILEQLDRQRTSLIISIFHVTGPMIPSSTLLESLAITLLDWDKDLDSFLSQQDSLLQHRASLRPSPTRRPSYSKSLSKLIPYLDTAISRFSEWLSKRTSRDKLDNIRRNSGTVNPTQDTVKDWVENTVSPNTNPVPQKIVDPSSPTYVVDCPKLHAIPKTWLADQLSWCDKWAYESMQKNSPTVHWKEGIQCPNCTSGARIKSACLIEPLQQPSTAPSNMHQEDYSSSQYSMEGSTSYGATSSSAESHLNSDSGIGGVIAPSQTTMTVTIPTSVSQSSSDPELPKCVQGPFPHCRESPISPFTQIPLQHRARSYGSGMADYTKSPLNESLNVPIPTGVESRSSLELPIPIPTPPVRNSMYEKISLSAPPDISSLKSNTPPSTVTWNEASTAKSKQSSRTIRIANSMRRKSSSKEKDVCALPKDPILAFSTSGHSLLLLGRHGNNVVRFDIPTNDTAEIQCCRYEADDIEAAAIGHCKCAIIAASGALKKKLLIFTGINTIPDYDIELECFNRVAGICIAVSRDDKHVAISGNGLIELYSLENGLKRMAFHHQVDVYELRGGLSHRRSIPITRATSDDSVRGEMKAESGSWFTEQSKCLSSKEAAEEQSRQTAIVTRKLYFSTDSERLVVATQLGDHCVYVDVWDITREPVSTISEQSRSFKLPPWTLNDGDLTGVFYDSARHAALVTAFLGKEYPILVPFPGYEPLQNETYSTKIVAAAQSPSGSTFIVANGMTETVQFQYTAKGTLAPHRLKKSSSKIPSSVFKPGAIVLAMPIEDCLRAFWIKDGKCMLRSIKLGSTERIKDVDIRAQYDRLMSLKDRPVIARAQSLSIPELDAGEFI